MFNISSFVQNTRYSVKHSIRSYPNSNIPTLQTPSGVDVLTINKKKNKCVQSIKGSRLSLAKKSWRCEGGGVCAERIKYTAKGFVFLGFVLFLHTVLQLYYYIFVQLFIELDSLFPPHNLLNLHRTSFDNFQPKMNLPPNFISKN